MRNRISNATARLPSKITPTQQLDTQQAKVDQLNAQIKGDQAAIDNAQIQLSYTTIRSPLTGTPAFA